MILINPRKYLKTIEPIGDTYYVSPTGSGSDFTYENPGDAKAGIALAEAGDSVIFLDGVYIDSASTWECAFNVSRSGTEGNPITLRSYNPRGAILTRRNSWMPSIAVEHFDYITIDGFLSEGMIHALDAHHTIVKNCEVIKGSIQGGDTSLHWGIGINASSNCLVQNNWVHDMEDIGNHGHNSACIMVFGAYTDNLTNDNVVEFNTVDGSYPNGDPDNIYCAYGAKSGFVHRTIYRNNFGRNCYATFFDIASSGDTGYNDGWEVYQNIGVDCNTLFYSYDGSRNISIYNNSFYGTQFMHKPDYSPNPTVEDRNFKIFNNLFVGNYYMAVERSSVDWSYLLEYSDYNRGQANTTWGWSYNGNMSLATWRTTTGKDTSSSDTTPNFVNAGGHTPEDYKRSSYPTDGRGGEYSNVMGAYITGTEEMGCDFTIY